MVFTDIVTTNTHFATVSIALLEKMAVQSHISLCVAAILLVTEA